MNKNDNDRDYLKELAPRLFSEEMDEVRDVPDGYFESLEGRVLDKVRQESGSVPRGKIRSLVNVRNLSIAAGLALLLALVPILKSLNEPNATVANVKVEADIEAISEDAAALYLAEEYDIESLASELDFEYSEVSSEKELSEDEILDYLLESDISETMIYESL